MEYTNVLITAKLGDYEVSFSIHIGYFESTQRPKGWWTRVDRMYEPKRSSVTWYEFTNLVTRIRQIFLENEVPLPKAEATYFKTTLSNGKTYRGFETHGKRVRIEKYRIRTWVRSLTFHDFWFPVAELVASIPTLPEDDPLRVEWSKPESDWSKLKEEEASKWEISYEIETV